MRRKIRKILERKYLIMFGTKKIFENIFKNIFSIQTKHTLKIGIIHPSFGKIKIITSIAKMNCIQ